MYYNNELRLAMRVVWSVFYVVWARVVVWGKKKRKKACRRHMCMHMCMCMCICMGMHRSFLLPQLFAYRNLGPKWTTLILAPKKGGHQPWPWI
jgi:hypothetical protein